MKENKLKSFKEYRAELEQYGKLISIGEVGGIYKVYMPTDYKMIIRPTTDAITNYKGKSMLYTEQELVNKWEKICQRAVDKEILYIGKASKSKTRNLRKRLTEYLKYGYGEVKNHRGGRAIWQLEDNKELLVEIIQCENPEEREKELLIEYHQQCGEYPFANWRI